MHKQNFCLVSFSFLVLFTLILFDLVHLVLNPHDLDLTSLLFKNFLRELRANTDSFYTSLGVLVLFMLIIVPMLLFRTRIKTKVSETHVLESSTKSADVTPCRSLICIDGEILLPLTLSLVFALFVISFPLSHYYPLPGGDAVAYVAYMKKGVNFGIPWLIMNRERPIVGVLVCILYYLTNEYQLSLILLNFLSAVIFLLSNYYLLEFTSCLKHEINLIIASLSLILPSTLWYLGDLYASFFAFSLMFSFFIFFMKYLKTGSWTLLVTTVFFSALIALSHQETFFFCMFVSIGYFIMEEIYQFCFVSHSLCLLKKGFWLFAIILVSLSPFVVLSQFEDDYRGAFSRYIGPSIERYGTIFFFNSSSFSQLQERWHANPYWGDTKTLSLLFQEYGQYNNLVLFFLSVSGLLILDLRRDWERLFYSWSCLTSITSLLSIIRVVTFPYPARIMLLMPFPIGLAFSVRSIQKIITRIVPPKNVFFKLGKIRLESNIVNISMYLLLALLFMYSFNITLRIEMRYFSDAIHSIGAPEPSTIESIEKIVEKFGYGNDTIIIIAQNNKM